MVSQRQDTAFYRQLFEEVSDAIFVYDPENGVVVDANPAAATLTGYAVETLTGSPVTQFTAGTPEDVGRAAAEIVDQSLENDQQFEWLVERADGTVRTTEVTLHRTAIDGRDRVLAIMRDVTERETERAELEQHRARLSLVTEQSPDVFWMFSPDWEECLYVNDAYERVFGRPTEALESDTRDFLAAVHPEDRERVSEAMERLADGSRVDLEYRVNASEDFGRWVWVEGVPVVDENGETSRLVGYSRDVTRQKELEAQLRAQNEQLSALTDNLPLVLFELDAEGVFRQSLGRGVAELNRGPNEVLGRSVFEVYEDNPEVTDACRRALSGESVKRTVEVGGTVFDAWYEPTRDEEGTVDGVIGVAVNVDDRERLQRELRVSEESLRELHHEASRTGRPFEERVRAMLEVGCDRLDLPCGFLTRISDGTQHVVEAIGSHDELRAGASAPLDEAYCRKTIATEGMLGVQNAASEGWRGDPAYERFGLECYLGGKVFVDEDLFGTVCFAGSEPRDREFSPLERAFVELLVQWIGTMVEREQYEAELRAANTELESVLETSPLAIVELDEEAVVKQWNPAAEDLFGVAAEDAIGRRYPAVPNSRQTDFAALFERVRAGERIDGVEVERERADGSELVLSLNAAPIENDAGEVTGAVATFVDITGQKRRQRRIEALRAAAQSLVGARTVDEVGSIAVRTVRAALGHPVCAMWVHDDDEDVLRPVAETEAAVDLVGPAPTIGRDEGLFWETLGDGSPRSFEDLRAMSDLLNPNTAIRSEIVVPVGDHGVFTVASSEPGTFDEQDVGVLETLAGALDAALTRLEDEATLRAREAELSRRNEMLDEFASVVAHDIRGPLSAAVGFLELARETDEETFYTHVERAHARMEQLIDDLLTLARKGKSIDEREPVDLASVARTAWSSVSGEATLDVAGDLPVLSADGTRLEEVLYNLFRNAIDHGGEDVTVRIGGLEDGDGFYVEDDGPGVPPERRDLVFDFGYTDSETGTGLGLAIVQGVVEAHGWDVSVSDGSDGGARFEVRTGAGPRWTDGDSVRVG